MDSDRGTESKCPQTRRTAPVLPLLDNPNIKALIGHRGNTTLDRSLDHTLRDIIQFCLLSPAQYDTVSFGSNDNTALISAAETHYLLYSYIINRASAIDVCVAQEFIVRDGLRSSTDDAFVHIANTLMRHESVQEEGNGTDSRRVLKLEGDTIERAFRVFKDTPMRFKVQPHHDRDLGPVEYAIFWFTPSRSGVGCDTAWEFVSQSYASCFHRDEDYEIG